MKIRELIAVLVTFDAELNIKVYHKDWSYNTNIDKIYLETDNNDEVILETFEDAR